MRWFVSDFRMFRLLAAAEPKRVCVQILASCLRYAYGAVYALVFFRYLINALESGAPLLSTAAFFVLFSLLGLLDAGLNAYLRDELLPSSDERLRAWLLERLCEKTSGGGIAPYENPKTLDERARAAETAREGALEFLGTAADFCALLLGLGWSLGFACAVEPRVMLPVLLALSLSLFGQRARSQSLFALQRDLASPARRADVAAGTFFGRAYAKELRLSRVGECLRALYDRALRDQQSAVKAHATRAAALGALAEMGVECLLYVLVYLLICHRYLAHRAFGLGDLTSLFGATVNLIYFSHALLAAYASLRRQGLSFSAFHGVLESRPDLADGGAPCAFAREIRFEGVGFSYGGKPVLKNLNLCLKKGERVALVGLNGCGKTTLVKLLLRLYDPTEGRILMDGRDIRDFDLRAYRAMFAAVFQDFQLYALTVEENVSLGEEGAARRAGEALRQAGLALDPSRELTREFDPDGLVLSGGQAQRIAAARILASDAPIAVLDEPSSALDPLAERDAYETLLRACAGRTLLLISHRLSSVRDVDRVLYLEEGRVLEQGSHQELMRLGGRYAALYNQQAEAYRKEVCAHEEP